MTLKNYYRQGSDRVRQAEDRGVPVYVLRNNTVMQMERQLADVFQINGRDEADDLAPPAPRRSAGAAGCTGAVAGGAEGRVGAQAEIRTASIDAMAAATGRRGFMAEVYSRRLCIGSRRRDRNNKSLYADEAIDTRRDRLADCAHPSRPAEGQAL